MWQAITQIEFLKLKSGGELRQTAGGEMLGGGFYSEWKHTGDNSRLYRTQENPDGSLQYFRFVWSV